MVEFFEDCRKAYPLPRADIHWLACTEESEYFVKGKSNA
jgi:hypothetical protein